MLPLSVLGENPFYRGQVSVGNNCTALMFASDGQLDLIRPAQLMYIDSTFHVVPSLYHQLFTMFVPYADHAFPVLYALMTQKTTELYQAVFQRLHELAPDFHPLQVIADFEEAPAAAVRAVFGSDVVISGCWFHYAQALVKRLRKEGLADAYKNEPDIQKVFRCLLALPLLPAGDILPAFGDVKA